MINKIFDRVLKDNEDGYDENSSMRKVEDVLPSVEKPNSSDKLDGLIFIIIFVVALAARLVFLYKFTDPQNPGDGWAGDTFHHWQVAYLTKEIGMHEGFMRLWDLKGMEYFWGPLHPVILMLIFALSGSVSIVIPRLVSATFGSLVIALFYPIVKKHWGRNTALATVFLALALPVGILDDTFGLLEPIAMALLMTGIVILKKHPAIAGVLWALSCFVRAEAWIFSAILIVMSPRALKKSGQIPKLLIAYGIVMIFYLKYLLDSTGNPIYPIWWNYLANAKGAWATEIIYTDYQLMIKPFMIGLFVISLISLLIVLWRNRKESSIFLVFGLSTLVFLGGMMGLTHYLTGFQPWFFIIRFFQFPYYFIGFVFAYLVTYFPATRIKVFRKKSFKWVLWIPIFIYALLLQLFWPSIMEKYNSTRPGWEQTKSTAMAFASQYSGGKVLIPDGDPNITYAMVYFGGIEGKNILGQMFDPFYYIEGDAFDNWGDNRYKVLEWIKNEDIRLILLYDNTQRYLELFEKEPKYFKEVLKIPTTRLIIYEAYPTKINLE